MVQIEKGMRADGQWDEAVVAMKAAWLAEHREDE
jgi:hypothetical protein